MENLVKSQDKYQTLTSREKEILSLIVEGRTNKEIAEGLHLSVYTVRTYCQRIMGKLGLHSRVQLATYAVKKGIGSTTANQ